MGTSTGLRYRVTRVLPQPADDIYSAGFVDATGGVYMFYDPPDNPGTAHFSKISSPRVPSPAPSFTELSINGKPYTLPVPTGMISAALTAAGNGWIWGAGFSGGSNPLETVLIWNANQPSAPPKTIPGYHILAVRPDGGAAMVRTVSSPFEFGLLGQNGNFQVNKAATQLGVESSIQAINQNNQFILSPNTTSTYPNLVSASGSLTPLKEDSEHQGGPSTLNDAGECGGAGAGEVPSYWDSSGNQHVLPVPTSFVTIPNFTFVSTSGTAISSIGATTDAKDLNVYAWPSLNTIPVLITSITDGLPAGTTLDFVWDASSDGSYLLAISENSGHGFGACYELERE